MKEEIIRLLSPNHPWRDRIHWLEETDSTNTQVKTLALSGAPHGTVVIAGHQTGGRGRMGRSFHSPGGMGVYLSILLRPGCEADRLMHLTCATAVAACEAVEKSAGLRPGIKWTNDLVIGKRKLGGILTELTTTQGQLCVIVGIGINCTQQPADLDPGIRDFACSLAMAADRPVSVESVAAALIESLYHMDQRLLTEKAEIMEAYRRDCITLGQDVRLLRADTVRYGHAEDIDENGALLVRFEDGHTETVNSGEISVRGMYGYT